MEEDLEDNSWAFHCFSSKMIGVMSQHSLTAETSHLASPNCKGPVKQDLFQALDTEENQLLVSTVSVNPTSSVCPFAKC